MVFMCHLTYIIKSVKTPVPNRLSLHTGKNIYPNFHYYTVEAFMTSIRHADRQINTKTIKPTDT